MATRAEYDVFRSVLDEESTRLTELVTRAKVYLSVATFFLATLFVKMDVLFVPNKCLDWVRAAYALSVVFFSASVLATVLSLRILMYERLFDPRSVLTDMEKESPTESVFFDARLADVVVATERNSEQNDKRANCLSWAGGFIVAGFAASLCWGIAAVVRGGM